MSLSPWYSWFNHSCAPSVGMESPPVCGCPKEELGVLKAVEKDEELFVIYIGPHLLAKVKEERQRGLASWLGGDCKCQRCKEE